MTKNKLKTILENHLHWINEDCDNWENMRADLQGADLQRADLQRADLQGANLWGADLQRADLQRADLQGADLQRADLRRANLQGANLRRANLQGANLRKANLRKANLQGANLWETDLQGTKNLPESVASRLMACPEEGSFIGWKKCGDHIIKLLIPEDAKRSSATTRKCRCSKVKVLDIQNVYGSREGITEYVHFAYGLKTVYKIGEMVYPDCFDEDRWNECSHGIHFFITRQEAVDYH